LNFSPSSFAEFLSFKFISPPIPYSSFPLPFLPPITNQILEDFAVPFVYPPLLFILCLVVLVLT